MEVASTCSLCNSRICPRHRLISARTWHDDRATGLKGGIQVFCVDKETCFRGQNRMCQLARTLEV